MDARRSEHDGDGHQKSSAEEDCRAAGRNHVRLLQRKGGGAELIRWRGN